MSNQDHRLRWRLFMLAGVLLIAMGGLISAPAQPVPGGTGFMRPARASDPKVNAKYLAHAGNRSAKLSAAEEKHQAIEQAIADGNEARNKNNYEQALDHYQKVAKELNPKDERAFYGLGNIYSDLSCNDSAIEAYRKAIELKKDYPEALVSLGYAYAGKERYDEAEEQFQAALSFKSRNADANLGLGYVYAKKGKYQEAIDRINSVINDKSTEVQDRSTAYFMLGLVYENQNKRQEAIAQYETAKGLLRPALTSIDSKNTAQHEKAMSMEHDLAQIYFYLGNAQLLIAYSKLGSFTDVNEINMQDLEAFHAAAKQAFANLDDANNKYHYNHPNLHEVMALALASQFRYEEAIKQINDYFEEVKKLESRISPQATKCGAGFDHLKASGYYYWGYVYFLEGHFDSDAQRRNEFFDKAVEQFNQAIRMKEDYAEAYRAIGGIYDRQKKYQEAINNFDRAIQFSTNELDKAGLYFQRGMAYSSLAIQAGTVYSGLGHYIDDAIKNVQEAIKRNPNDPSFYESLAILYGGLGKLEESIAQLNIARDLRVKLKLESAANLLPYVALGQAYSSRFQQTKNEEDFNEAVKALTEATKIRPNYALVYEALGHIYQIHSNADEALKNYNEASRNDPKNPQYYWDIANVYFSLKHNGDAAIGFLNQAINLKPDFVQAYWSLGIIYHDKKDAAKAIESLQNAIKYDPKFALPYYHLGQIYREQNNYPEAIKHLTTAIEIASSTNLNLPQLVRGRTFALFLGERGKAYQESSHADEALADFNKALEYDPKNLVYYLNIAAVYRELKHDDDAAAKQLLKAIELDPKYLDAYSMLAEIYKRQKNYSDAIKYLTAAIKNVPDVPWTYKDLAKVYEAQGNTTEAIRCYEQAIEHLDATRYPSTKSLYLGRIARLKGRYDEAISYFQKLPPSEFAPGQANFDLGTVYVARKDKKAALAEYEQLKALKSSLADDLLRQINEMK